MVRRRLGGVHAAYLVRAREEAESAGFRAVRSCGVNGIVPKSFAYPLPDYDEQNANAVPVEVEPGDAVMHTAPTVHWTFDPIEYRDRNAMVFVYRGASSAVDPMGAKKSRSAYADGATTL